MAAGVPVDEEFIAACMDKRRARGDGLSTPRVEADNVQLLSGVVNGHTTGTAIALMIENQNTRSGDYAKTADLLRPGHADYTAYAKYHGFQDARGGGHFSGRITAALVAGGAIVLGALNRAGIDITKPDGHMVVDIGGGTSDIAVISLSGVVESASIKVAGDQFNESIVKYMRRKHNILIGERTAEQMKMEIGCVYPKEEEATIEIKGRCLMTGLPKTITVNSTEMMEAFEEPVERILEAVHNVLERTPPELVADISNNGIVMTGGGSLVDGFDKLITARTGIHTVVAEDAISCVAEGTGKSLDSLGDMQDGTVNLSRRRQMN